MISQRINESDDRSASLITTISPYPLDELRVNFVPPGVAYTKQLDFPHLVDLAKTQVASIGEKGVSSMVGCTIGDIVPIDVSGQSRDIDLSVGQVGRTLSLPEEGDNTDSEQLDLEKYMMDRVFPTNKLQENLIITWGSRQSSGAGITTLCEGILYRDLKETGDGELNSRLILLFNNISLEGNTSPRLSQPSLQSESLVRNLIFSIQKVSRIRRWSYTKNYSH